MVKKRRKIVVYIATSADGFIARSDGDVAWLDRPRPKGNYGMGEFFRTIDTILWGRKTYGKGIEKGMKAAGFGKGIKNGSEQQSVRALVLRGFLRRPHLVPSAR